DKRDRRVVMKGIIEDGLRTLNEGMKIYEELVEEILNGINEDEIRELLSKLNLILSRIESSID
ncbi:MAG: MarR family transcriptional regulator, partial [Saccharolobus sp.]|nr:MarR family transcriptional regulator [Saccharolobus sp.]